MTEKQLFYPLLSVYFSLILGDLQKEKLQIVSIFRFGHKKKGTFSVPSNIKRGKKPTKMKNVIQGDCPCCPYADLYGGYCSYYHFFPANINFGEATCRFENLKPRKEEEQ